MGMLQNPIILCRKHIVFCDNINKDTLAAKQTWLTPAAI